MQTSRFARRRRQVGVVLAGLCVVAGSVGNAAVASRGRSGGSGNGSGSGSGSGTSLSVEARVMVQAGMSPIHARQAAANLNAAIDSAARSVVRAAVSAIPAGRPVRTTAGATRAFANEVDAALTEFSVQTVAGLKAAGVSTIHLANGTLAALNQVVRTVPGAVAVTTGAEISVIAGSDGASVSASLNPVVDTAVRQTISDSVHAIRPVLPLSRATLQAVGAGVRSMVDASVVATKRIVRATVDLAAAAVGVATTTLQAARAVAESTCDALDVMVAAVDATLDDLSDVNITAAVDASLTVSAG